MMKVTHMISMLPGSSAAAAVMTAGSGVPSQSTQQVCCHSSLSCLATDCHLVFKHGTHDVHFEAHE